jgi:kynurenine formamidase
VLVATGWDRHWGSDAYYRDHSFLTLEAAERLIAGGAALVGIDSHNIDDTRVRTRPVHTALLGAGIIICEHMTNLGAVPDSGFHFTAAPPKVRGMGTFPVRAYALIEG